MIAMATFHLIGKLAESPRGKRLERGLSATPTPQPPEVIGLGLATGQDYQTRTPAEQRKWLAWAARPGCALLLIPPFQTAVRHEPNAWEVARLDKPPILDRAAHPVLRLTQPEISICLAHGLTQTMSPTIEAGCPSQLSGLFRKHPDSGIFAATAIPLWSVALTDHVPALTEWLAAWAILAGRPPGLAAPPVPRSFEPTQRHFSVLLYLASGKFANRTVALEALAWNDTFQFEDADVSTLLDDLHAAGLAADGALTETGRRALLESDYRPYAEACLSPASSL